MEDVAPDIASRGPKDRFKMAKLGTMVKDLEGLKLGDGISMGIPSGFTGSFSIGGRGPNNNSA